MSEKNDRRSFRRTRLAELPFEAEIEVEIDGGA
jgi:hypothetical protein